LIGRKEKMAQYYTQRTPQGLFGAMRQFGDRGGFVNGLNPGIIGRIWYVNGLGPDGAIGSDSNTGSQPGQSFSTIGRALEMVDSYDIIVADGVFREQVTAPLGVHDVKIISAANRPRQATSGGTPTGGGATWLAPTAPVAATPLLQLREQGWLIEGFLFSPPADDSAIKLHREDNATYPDASHVTIRGCRFVDGLIGIEDYGGASNVLIEDCSFESLAGVGGGAIVVTNQGIAIPNRWIVRGNRILPCVNGIVGAWIDSQFTYNTIMKCTTTTIKLNSGNVGLRNIVKYNDFNIAAVDFDPAGGVEGNATDTWVNDLSDVKEFGVPAN
jgi:hypothetical protein